MPKATKILSSFVGGEFSPLLEGRVDLAKYQQGAQTIKNLIVAPQGGLTRRPGTRFVAKGRVDGKAKRLIPFEFSVIQSYMLEFGDSYIKIYRDQGQISTSQNITGISKAATAVVTVVGHGYITGATVNINDVVGMTEVNNRYFVITVLTADTFELNGENSTAHTAYASGGTTVLGITGISKAATAVVTVVGHGYANGDTVDIANVVGMTEVNNRTFEIASVTANTFALKGEDSTTHTAYASGGTAISGLYITSPYAEADLDTLQYTQDADTMWIMHPSYKTRTLVRTSHTAWALANYAPTNDPFGADGSGDTPATAVIFEDRIWFAGTTNAPQGLFSSISGDYDDMSIGTGTAAGDSLRYTVGSGQINAIRWLEGLQTLLVGTVGGEFVVSGGVDTAITPTNMRVVKQSSYGSANLVPGRVGNRTLFVPRAGRKLRQLVFSFDVEGYIAPDLTILADHILDSGARAIAYQQEPESVVWLVRNDGTLVGLTYLVDQEVAAWHRHTLGGISDAASTPALVESIAVLAPVTPTGREELWLSVLRYVNGEAIRHIEVMDEGMALSSDILDAHFVDSGLVLDNPIDITGATVANPVVVNAIGHGLNTGNTVAIRDVKGMVQLNNKKFLVVVVDVDNYNLQSLAGNNLDGTGFTAYISGGESRKAFSSLSGLEHLEGESVSILADGAVHPAKTVTDATVTFDYPVAIAHIGLGYVSDLQTLRIEAGSLDGTSQSKTKRIRKVGIRLNRTVGIKIGPDDANLDIVPFRDSSDPMNEPIQPFTGDKFVAFPNGYDTNGVIFVRQDQPLPVNILALIAQVKTND